MHGLLGTDCTQASSFGCISPEGLSYCLGVRGALPAPRHQSTSCCSLLGLSGGKGTHRCAHDLGSTVSTQAPASLCGCTRPERANRLMLHLAVYVMHCQHPNTKLKATHGAACSLSLLARGHADAWPAWHRLHTGISLFWCISPEGLSSCLGVRGALPSPSHQSTSWCSLFGLSGGKETHRCMT